MTKHGSGHLRTKSTLLYLALLGLFVILPGACGGTANPTGQQPIEVVSVTGPIPPINPGGPNVQVTLKNVSAEPVVSLTASLGIFRAAPANTPFLFNFDVTASNPLLPAASISSTLTLIGGGFSDSASYPLEIEGKQQSGGTFAYIEQVQIGSPSVQNPDPWPGVAVYVDPNNPIMIKVNETFSIVLPPAPLFGWGWQNSDLTAFSLVETKTISGPSGEPNPYGPTAFLFKALETGTFQITLYVPSKPPQQMETFEIFVSA